MEIQRQICDVAFDIQEAWGAKVNYAAKPYLEALMCLTDADTRYGCEDAKSIVLYFLSNAGGFRGHKAKELKAELKKLVGIK